MKYFYNDRGEIWRMRDKMLESGPSLGTEVGWMRSGFRNVKQLREYHEKRGYQFIESETEPSVEERTNLKQRRQK